jgi:metal-responsive CopG/Arc/MetJ family transcriptional regulator
VIYIVRRLYITITEDIAKRLDNVRNKSKFISDAVREKLEKLEKEKLEKLLEEGYKAVKEEDKKINDEWEKITLEGWK